MPLFILKQDITKMRVDAIVNAANPSLLGGGGVDGAIHRAAGPMLKEECSELGGCVTGDAKITGAYGLPCRYVIHTVGPIWRGGSYGEKELLYSCYKKSLELAVKNGCSSVAFPLISSGAYGYPRTEAFSVAASAIGDFLLDNEMDVYLTVFGDPGSVIGRDVYAEISGYILKNKTQDDFGSFDSTVLSCSEASEETVCLHGENERQPLPLMSAGSIAAEEKKNAALKKGFSLRKNVKRSLPHETAGRDGYDKTASAASALPLGNALFEESLEDKLTQIDESFSQMLLRKIDEKGMKDSECYKRANVDRKLFSKIRGDVLYKPSKITAIAFAVALELSLEETKELLMKAGFALSHSNKFDLIIEYFINKGNYDIFKINEALFAFDQAILG